MVRDAVLDATVPLLQRLRALEEEMHAGGGPVSRAPIASPIRNSVVDGVIISAKPTAPYAAPRGSAPSTAAPLVDDADLAVAFNGARRGKQMAWILGLLALFAVGAAVIGAILSNGG